MSDRKRSKAKDCISFLPTISKPRANSSKSDFHDWETNLKGGETSSLAWIFFASRNYLVHSKNVIQISRARLGTVGNIGTNCATSWYKLKAAKEKDLTPLYSGGIVPFVYVCHVQYILMQQDKSRRVGLESCKILGELPTPILQVKAGWG